MARSVFHDLFSEEEAAELEMRAKLLSGINKWLNKSGLTQTEAAEQLGVTQARISEIKNGKINRFSLSMLVRLAQRAGLRPRDQVTEGSVTAESNVSGADALRRITP
jgi:predicted XRE-type DNA-binding protein